MTSGALIGGSGLNVVARLLLGWDFGWIVFATGSVVGAAVGCRQATPLELALLLVAVVMRA